MSKEKWEKSSAIAETIQLSRENKDALASWCNGKVEGDSIAFETPKGIRVADVGDFIMKGIRGEFHSVKPDIFINFYDEALSGLLLSSTEREAIGTNFELEIGLPKVNKCVAEWIDEIDECNLNLEEFTDTFHEGRSSNKCLDQWVKSFRGGMVGVSQELSALALTYNAYKHGYILKRDGSC